MAATPLQTSPTRTAPTVVYLAGSGRSGSTLVERALGSMPGFVNVGELIDIVRRVAVYDERCGCGAPFFECEFWTKVGVRAYGGWTPDLLSELADLQSRIARQRRIAHLLARSPRSAFAADVQRYQRLYAALYQAILEEADARYVVDASKWPAQALALQGDEVDLRVIHLVRDARGVANSMRKEQVARPHARLQSERMQTRRPAVAAAEWTLTQTEVDLLRLKRVPIATMSYEKFVAQPRSTVRDVLGKLSIDTGEGAYDHFTGSGLRLGPSHGLSGNPSRFKDGEVGLRLDEAWRTSLGSTDRLVVTLIGLPHLVTSGRLLPSLRTRSSRDVEPGRDSAPAEAEVPDERSWPSVSVVLTATDDSRRTQTQEVIDALDDGYPGRLEFLVAHDGDVAPRRASALDPRVTELVNHHAPGQAGCRNTALDAATGDLIAFGDPSQQRTGNLRRLAGILGSDPDPLAALVDAPFDGWTRRGDRRAGRQNPQRPVPLLVMRRDARAKVGWFHEGDTAADMNAAWVRRASRVGLVVALGRKGSRPVPVGKSRLGG